MKIVLTGSTGNLGTHIGLLPQHQFLKIDRKNWNEIENISVNEYEAAIHCAYDLKNPINRSPYKNLESNIMATAKLLELCRAKGIKKFIFISSCAVYGDSSNSSEEKLCTPVTMNGHIKLLNEELVKSYCSTNDINYLILRLFNTYGGQDEFSVVQKMIDCARSGNSFTLMNGGVSERDFIHVEDAAKIISQILDLNLRKEVINIGSGDSVKIIDILRAVEKKYGPIKIDKENRLNEAIFSRANISKLKSLISFESRKILNDASV
jgi:UDP-glucose 4-epimerase